MKKILLVALLALQGASWAQDGFPGRAVTIINPWAAGSPTDLMARTLADQFRQQWGRGVVVVSREGGSGVIGMNVLSQAPADGLTLAFTPLTPITVQPHYVKSLKLRPDSVQPLCGVTENILGISVRSDSPFRSISDLIMAGKSRSLNYGSPGPNSAPFLAIDQLTRDQNLELVHIPFKGDAASIQELLAGRLDFVSSIAASAAPQIQAGKLRLLAVASARRHPGYPDVPTLKELGLPVLEESFAGLFVPRGVPEPILAKLDAACALAAASDAVHDAAAHSHQVVAYLPRAAWERRIDEQFRKQRDAFRRTGAVAQ